MHGFALAPDLGRGFTSHGRANSSTIVDLKTLAPLGTVQTGANPDSIRYLRDRKEVWTFNHTGKSITAFDPMTGKVIATIDVGGVLEEAVEDDAANRVYVNVEDKGAIGVVDTVKTQSSGRTMWLDPTTHNVFLPVGTTTQGPNGRGQIAPNSMKILVLAMGQ